MATRTFTLYLRALIQYGEGTYVSHGGPMSEMPAFNADLVTDGLEGVDGNVSLRFDDTRLAKLLRKGGTITLLIESE